MTAIAFDGSTLATDTGYFQNGIMMSGPKIFYLPGNKDMFNDIFGTQLGKSVFAFTGSYGCLPLLLNAIRKNNPKLLPDLKDDNAIWGLVLDLDKGYVYSMESSLALLRYNELPVVRGSAHMFVYGAIIGGMNAEDAVKATILYTDHAGRHLNVFRLTREQEDLFSENYSAIKGFLGHNNATMLKSKIKSELDKFQPNIFGTSQT